MNIRSVTLLALITLFPASTTFAITNIQQLIGNYGNNPYNALNALISSGKPLIVKFFKNNCPGCSYMAPVVDGTAQLLPNVTFVEINIVQYPGFVSLYQLKSVPNIFYFNNGAKVTNHSGNTKKATGQRWTAQSLADNIRSVFNI